MGKLNQRAFLPGYDVHSDRPFTLDGGGGLKESKVDIPNTFRFSRTAGAGFDHSNRRHTPDVPARRLEASREQSTRHFGLVIFQVGELPDVPYCQLLRCSEGKAEDDSRA